MRNARSRFGDVRKTLAALLIGGFCAFGLGCHQHHYYYGSSAAGPCPPMTGAVVPSNVSVGAVCEVPSEVDGGTVVGSHSTVVDDGRSKPRVVVSQPERRASRFGWRGANPEDIPAMTHIDGAVGSTVK